MTTTFFVRRTQHADGALFRKVRTASLTDAPDAFGAKLEDVLALPDSAFEAIAQRHSTSEASTSFLLFSGPELAGTVGAFFDESQSNRSFICALWVDPACRGTLAAWMLVDSALKWLLTRRQNDVFAWVADRNQRALRFYRKIGFVPTAETQALPSDPSQRETLLRLTPAAALDAKARLPQHLGTANSGGYRDIGALKRLQSANEPL